MDIKARLSALWLLATLNYLYCDVIGLMDSNLLKQFYAGAVNGIPITQGFLLGGAILIEIPMAMVALSIFLPYGLNRWANIAAGSLMTVVQLSTLILTPPAGYYIFCSVIEVTCTALIVWYAWTRRKPVVHTQLDTPASSS
jgi:Family of unknown function (DUF6326)